MFFDNRFTSPLNQHFSSKIQDWNSLKDILPRMLKLNLPHASTIINCRAVWPIRWLTDNLTASSRFLVWENSIAYAWPKKCTAKIACAKVQFEWALPAPMVQRTFDLKIALYKRQVSDDYPCQKVPNIKLDCFQLCWNTVLHRFNLFLPAASSFHRHNALKPEINRVSQLPASFPAAPAWPAKYDKEVAMGI